MLAQPRHIEDLGDCFFYHTMELPKRGVVRGLWDLRGRFDDYVGGVNVANKSVLDLGTATGFLSFEAEKRGARVVSFDMSDARQQAFLPFKERLYYQDYESFIRYHNVTVEKWKNAYWFCHRLLQSKARVYYGDIYRLPEGLGKFDVVLVGAVLEHLSDQVSALASISRVTKDKMVLVTPVLETDERIARFEPTADNPEYDFTWWIYSIGVYREVLTMLGFNITRISAAKYFYEHGGTYEERTTIVASRS